MSLLEEHFARVRKTLLAMYDESKAGNHSVVTGTLREGFVRAALQGHLPKGASWSTGQMVGYAPANKRSGQLDILLHSGELPQIYIHDGYVRLIPSDACIAVVEVKSDITTGKADKPKSTASLPAALASLVKAKDVPRELGVGPRKPVPVHIVGFRSGIQANKVAKSISDFFQVAALNPLDYWPDGVVVLRGAKKTSPQGYGLFRDSGSVVFPPAAVDFQLNPPIQGLELKRVDGTGALAVLVATLANEVATFGVGQFKLERYVY